MTKMTRNFSHEMKQKKIEDKVTKAMIVDQRIGIVEELIKRAMIVYMGVQGILI